MIEVALKKIPVVGGVGCSQARKVARTAAAESSRAVERTHGTVRGFALSLFGFRENDDSGSQLWG